MKLPLKHSWGCSGHSNVQSQVARGIANFPKCESHQVVQAETHFVFSAYSSLCYHVNVHKFDDLNEGKGYHFF